MKIVYFVLFQLGIPYSTSEMKPHVFISPDNQCMALEKRK